MKKVKGGVGVTCSSMFLWLGIKWRRRASRVDRSTLPAIHITKTGWTSAQIWSFWRRKNECSVKSLALLWMKHRLLFGRTRSLVIEKHYLYSPSVSCSRQYVSSAAKPSKYKALAIITLWSLVVRYRLGSVSSQLCVWKLERVCSQTQLYQLSCFNDCTRQLHVSAPTGHLQVVFKRTSGPTIYNIMCAHAMERSLHPGSVA